MAFTVKTAEFIKSAPSIKDAPDFGGLPEVVFVGRSNVGKSSCINSLLGRKNLAKTSNTPGKTRYINFYKINDSLIFVDLPGYGYAKVSHAEQEKWRKNLEIYLKQRETIQLVLQLVDARHPPQESDLQMKEWLEYQEIPYGVVLTKVDKISKNEIARQVQQAIKGMGIPSEAIFPYSGETHYGKDQLWKAIAQVF